MKQRTPNLNPEAKKESQDKGRKPQAAWYGGRFFSGFCLDWFYLFSSNLERTASCKFLILKKYKKEETWQADHRILSASGTGAESCWIRYRGQSVEEFAEK